jgi:hypothetical protein
VFGALHTMLDVIAVKPEVRNNLLVATILSFPTPVCWNRNAFGALGDPSSALDIGGSLLGMTITTRSIGDLSNVPLCHVTTRL